MLIVTVSPASAVAPCSVYVCENVGVTVVLNIRLIGFSLGLLRVTTGAVVSSVTVTVRVVVPVFPPVSVAEYVTVYTPSTTGETAPTDTAVPPPIGVRVILMVTVSPPSEVAVKYQVYGIITWNA